MIMIYSLLILFFIYSTTSIVTLDHTQFTYAQYFQNKNRNSTLYYGCEQYSKIFHCDRLHNKFESFQIQSNSSTLYHATDKPKFVPGKEGMAIQMYANHLKYTTFSNTSKTLAKQFSVAFWIRGTHLQDNTRSPEVGHIVSQFNDGVTAGWSFNAFNMKNLSKESVAFVVFNEKGQGFSPPEVPIYKNNRFVHIVGTFDGTSLKLFRDGKFYGETRFNGTYNYKVEAPLTLGGSLDSAIPLYWTGNIDDLRYYDRVISIDEIKKIFNQEHSSPNTSSNGLIGHWKFNGDLKDISGNNYHGNQRTLISSMLFAPDGRLFFSEKDTGHIKIMKNGKVNITPFATLHDYYSNWEQGLLGLAIDPDFNKNHFIYLFYSSVDKSTGDPFNRIVRFTDVDSQGKNKVVIMDNIPASKGYHSGGAMAFGKDNKLYVTVGDATRNTECGTLPNSTASMCPAQNTSSLLGKVLRINKDGSIPTDNPYPGYAVYNIGHLNMYGIAFDKSGFGLVSENGRSLYDEIDSVESGANYGSPTIQLPNADPGLSSNSSKPLRSYYIARCLTSMIYYDGNKLNHLKGKFLVGTLSPSSPIYALQVDKSSKQVVGEEVISLNYYPNNQVVALAMSPNGEIYYANYDINKLDSVNNTMKSQTLFPIEINYSPSILDIVDLSLVPSNKEMRIDVDTKLNSTDIIHRNNNSSNISTGYLKLNIPKQLLDEITNVTASIVNQNRTQSEIVDFTVQNHSKSDHTIVSISLKGDGKYRLSILGQSWFS